MLFFDLCVCSVIACCRRCRHCAALLFVRLILFLFPCALCLFLFVLFYQSNKTEIMCVMVLSVSGLCLVSFWHDPFGHGMIFYFKFVVYISVCWLSVFALLALKIHRWVWVFFRRSIFQHYVHTLICCSCRTNGTNKHQKANKNKKKTQEKKTNENLLELNWHWNGNQNQ